MYIKILFYFLLSTKSLNIYAQNESYTKKQIDLFGSVGFSFLSNLSDSIENFQSTTGSQLRIGSEYKFSGLYIFPKIGFASPVLGAGLQTVYTSKKMNERNFSGRYIIAWASLETNAGLKINIAPELKVYTLVNIGYAPATFIENDANNYYSRAKVKNHYYFGMIALGIVPLTDSIGMGGSFSVNNHRMDILNGDKSLTSASFNQFTIALVLLYIL